jgi:ankyrin repeat protein
LIGDESTVSGGLSVLRTKSIVLIGCLCLTPAATLLAASDSSRSEIVDAARGRDAAAVRKLLAKGADPNTKRADGATALHWAAHWDDVELVRDLLAGGANVDATTEYGLTPLALSAENGTNASGDIVELLLQKGANPNLLRASGETVLMTAAFAGNVKAVEALLARGANPNAKEKVKGQTALMWAASEGHLDVTRALLAHGAEVDARSMRESTALHLTARQGRIDMVRLLLDAGADINAKAADKSTALVVAVIRGHVDLAHFLLNAGAQVEVDGLGFSPLHWVAAKWETPLTVAYAESSSEWSTQLGIRPDRGQFELMKALLAHGGNPNALMTKDPGSNRFGVEQNGANDIMARSGSGFARPPAASARGATPFWLAARSADIEVMRFLIANGADPNLAAADGTTPLIAACGTEFYDSGRTLGIDTLIPESRRIEAIKFLMALGQDVSAQNAQGTTALHLAALVASDQLTKFLIDQGARVNLRNDTGDTPLKIAQGHQVGMQVRRYPTIAALLTAAGGTARPGPPGQYDQGTIDFNVELRKLLERRAGLVNELEIIDTKDKTTRTTSVGSERDRLQKEIETVDKELKKMWVGDDNVEGAAGVQQ